MNLVLRFKAFGLAGLCLGAGLSRLAAQQALYVDHHGSFSRVRSFEDNLAQIEEDGVLIRASGSNYALVKTADYLPVFVTVRHMKREFRSASEEALTNNGTSGALYFSAEFEAPSVLKNIFIVLEFTSEDGGKFVFPFEGGTLRPHELKSIVVRVPIADAFDHGKLNLHVFTDGWEVFNPDIPRPDLEAALDSVVAKRIANVQDAPPKPLVGPTPEYPAKLRKAGIKGDAKVSFVISPSGLVLTPELKSASDPAFGEAALAAIRQWRFLPKIKEGRAVETTVTLPFVFSPPQETTTKS